MLVDNTTSSVSGGNTKNHGLYNGGSSLVTVRGSTLNGSGNATNSCGLYNTSGTAVVAHSSLSAVGGATNYGLDNPNGATAKVGASQLTGSTFASNGVSLCPASYNGTTFQLLNASCQ